MGVGLDKNFASKAVRARLFLLAGSVLIALVLCELGLRMVAGPRFALRMQGGENFWQYLWLEHHGVARAKAQFTPDNPRVIYDPILGWRSRPNYRSKEFNLNSRGLRGTREYPYEKPVGERRIVVIGDSYSLGSFDTSFMPAIPDKAIYTALLEKILPGVSVINLGVDGYGTDQQLLSLRAEGFKYDPDLVVAAVFVDDLRRSTLSFRDYAKPRFELVDGKLALRGVPVPAPEVMAEAIKVRIPRSYVWATVRSAARTVTVARERIPLGEMEVDRLNEAIFNTLREEVEQHEAKLLVVVIPYPTFAHKTDRSEKFLRAWSRRTGVSTLLLRDVFLSLSRDTQAELYVGHWTPLGHRIAAEAIYKKILEEELLAELGQ